MSIDTIKLALEYLKDNQHLIADNERHAYVMEYNAFIERFEKAIEQAHKQGPVFVTAPSRQPLSGKYPLSRYINSAGINADDLPHIVVKKLERAIEAAHGVTEEQK